MPTLYVLGHETGTYSYGKVGTFKNYKDAVIKGQQLGGYGKFYVDTGPLAPSREDQLLLEPRIRAKKPRSYDLENAQLLD